MIEPPDFVTEHLIAAESLRKDRAVKEPTFSRGTYHIEVQEKGKKKQFVFLQVDDDGHVGDCFCSCKESESGNRCPHIAAAFLEIFNDCKEPLHVRFKKSLWNKLFQMEAKRNQEDPDCLIADANGGFSCFSQVKKELFYIRPISAAGKKRFKEIVSEKEKETEETSIKFSNLTDEELTQYKQGHASYQLKYELSFWSDLAKWFMHLQETNQPYQISFIGEPVPHVLEVVFEEVSVRFYISEVHLPWILPAFSTVKTDFTVDNEISNAYDLISYDETRKQLHFKGKQSDVSAQDFKQGVEVGDWIYVKDKGFFKKDSASSSLLQVVESSQIPEILQSHHQEISAFIPVHIEPLQLQYYLFFDGDFNLHIQSYIFEMEDLIDMKSAILLPWVYLPKKGFFKIEDWRFPDKEMVIEKAKVSEFVNLHRLWLHQFEGFKTHVGSLESRLTYFLSPDGQLSFDVELTFSPEDTMVFDEWIYIKDQGFFLKKDSSRLPIHPGMVIPKYEISSFISSHVEELEQVSHFFSMKMPVEEMGLKVLINDEGLICVSPKITYAANIDPSKVQLFGNYFYVENQGFTKIPPQLSIPEKYRKEVVVAKAQESAFLSYELEPLRPFITDVDEKLKKPARLQLKIRKIVRDSKRSGQAWLVDLSYNSELGICDIFTIWDAIYDKAKYVFSHAGFLTLKDPRYNWIRQLPKKCLDRKKGLIRLSTLEWMRLCAFEDLKQPQGSDPQSTEIRNLLQEVQRFETTRLLDISGLQSSLRPYQEVGVNWLWFLYCHGLSGLLCDDMGLGKTHQAMALLAAIFNADQEKRQKYLVVCPTSVIYHWQELLKKFLPKLRVCTYYGISRSLESFDSQFDLLLTSYGILRQASDSIEEISFEAAFFDEIQVAKNYASQTHQALSRIKARMKLGLTGTPIENRLREIKSLFDIVLPSYLPADAAFKELFVKPIEKENDEAKKALLGKLIKPFILRRKKTEVLKDLPEKIEEISYCDLSPVQRKLYLDVAMQMKETVYKDLKDEAKPVPYVHVFSALSKMKQICDHPVLITGDIKDYAKEQSGKWELFTELLNEALESGQKVVVFSQYLDMLNIIEMYLKKNSIGYSSIKGSTRDRNEQLRKFREDSNCQVFVASLLAAGVGIDLTVASIVIHYDRWWNPAKENQATDRVHRIGQNRGVQVFKLVTKNTIEEHIHSIIEKKKGLLEDIVGADDQINYLTREELIKVFELMFEEIQ